MPNGHVSSLYIVLTRLAPGEVGSRSLWALSRRGLAFPIRRDEEACPWYVLWMWSQENIAYVLLLIGNPQCTHYNSCILGRQAYLDMKGCSRRSAAVGRFSGSASKQLQKPNDWKLTHTYNIHVVGVSGPYNVLLTLGGRILPLLTGCLECLDALQIDPLWKWLPRGFPATETVLTIHFWHNSAWATNS